MITDREIIQERIQLDADYQAHLHLCKITPPDGHTMIPAIIAIHDRIARFRDRWNAHWADLDRAAADMPPSMRID